MNPPANWYPDPTGRHGQRYWDGAQWTEHVFTDGVQDVDPLDDLAPVSDDDDVHDGDDEAPVADEGTADARTDDAVADDAAVDEHTVEAAADELAPLPRRRPAGAREADDAAATSLDESSDDLDRPLELDTSLGLFSGAAVAEPTDAAWTPDDGPGAAGAVAGGDTTADAPDEETVAPELEPEDVIAAVDDVDEPAADFSDAFVLSPETASRLVGRTTSEPDAGEEAGAEEPDAEEPDAMAEEATGEPDPSAVLDAPPPTTVPDAGTLPTTPPSTGSLGLSGDLVDGAFAEREDAGTVALQNARLLRCSAAGGIIARQGTMVAYQGDVQFQRQGAGGMGRALKRAATGEGLAMMRITGRGDVFLADAGQHVFLLHLEGGPGLSVNGRNVLAFSASLQWDIERVKGASLLAGGLFNTTLTGTGWVALVSDGEPVVLRTDEAATHVDVNALVAWSAGLSTQIVNTVSAKSLVGLGSGEAFQMAFTGAGIVIVQPSEGPSAGASG